MGDILTPRRRDVVDRLRRRIEFYRRRQNGIQKRYEFGQQATYEAERQHALSLRQKWLESKAKKSSKKSKSDSSHPDLRNQNVTKRLKHKLDSNSTGVEAAQQHQPTAQLDNVYRFNDDDDPNSSASGNKTVSTSSSTNIDGLSSSVSVHIVHSINGASAQQDQKISTNVTVNQTINQNQNKASAESADSKSDLQSSVECKTEPKDDNSASANNNTNNNDLDDELEDILRSLKGDGLPPGDIIDELNKFDEICRNVHKDSEGSDSSLNKGSSESGGMFASSMYSDPAQGGQAPVRTPPIPPYSGRGSHPHTSMAEGGLAAETLKQMAAQHQQQQQPGPDQLGVKSAIDPFSDLSDSGQYSAARNGYTPPDYYPGMSGSQYSGQSGNMGGYPSKQQSMPSNYGPNPNQKQLAHFAHTPTTQASGETTPSSLQQLQNQVAHFNQGPQMEITQTQHMQVSDGVQRMQMSQTQHVAVRQPLQNISLTQQQGFSTSPNLGPTSGNLGPTSGQGQNFSAAASSAGAWPSAHRGEQMAMQQQMMQQQQQQQQQQQGKMHHDQQAQAQAQAHMQQYMNRPPPEYKMQHANGMPGGNISGSGMGGGGGGGGGGGTNPLQTIQNMVNQTNTHPNHAYSSVKSESNTDMQNGMRNGQMSVNQQQIACSVPPGGAMPMSQSQSVYSNQSVQRQASFPGALSHQMPGRPQRPNGPTYTSAIMRNQRPPNVNIGPDGLNISQPRHPQEWPRGMNPASLPQGARPGAPVTSASMMHYRSFSQDGAQMQMHHQGGQRSMHMDTMHSQQAAMMQGNAHAQQMMMQQQRIHMSQQMAAGQRSQQNNPNVQYNMTSQSGAYQQQGGGGGGGASQDDILNLLDTAPNQSTDFFDVQTSAGGSETNWDDFEYILNSK